MRTDEAGGAGDAYSSHLALLSQISSTGEFAPARRVVALTNFFFSHAASSRSNEPPKVVCPYSGYERRSITASRTPSESRRRIACRSSAFVGSALGRSESSGRGFVRPESVYSEVSCGASRIGLP